MITKAIVKGIPNVDSNKYRVYIPLLRNANDSEADATLEATLCFLNGIYYSLAVGDVVYIDFEDNYYEKPVIIGKLYTNKEDKNNIPTQITVKTINVLDKAQFPSNTELDGKSTSNFYKNIKDIQEDLWSLREQINELKWINLDDPDQNAFYQAVNNLNKDLESSQQLIDNLTVTLSDTTNTANSAIQEANKAKQDLAQTQNNLNQTNVELNTTKKTLASTQATVTALGTKLDETTSTLATSNEKIEAANQQIEETMSSLKNTQDLLDAANQQIDEATDNLSKSGERIDTLEAENADLKSRLNQAEEDINTNEKDITLKADNTRVDEVVKKTTTYAHYIYVRAKNLIDTGVGSTTIHLVTTVINTDPSPILGDSILDIVKNDFVGSDKEIYMLPCNGIVVEIGVDEINESYTGNIIGLMYHSGLNKVQILFVSTSNMLSSLQYRGSRSWDSLSIEDSKDKVIQITNLE